MKHGRYEALSECVGELWAEHAADRLKAVPAVMVVPIPLHWRRRWQRGYNQAEVLARALASRLHLACDARWLRRLRPTPKQTDVAPSARRGNVRGAFRVTDVEAIDGRTIVLVDDVSTTGATLHACAAALLDAGATEIRALVAAKAAARRP